MKPIVCGLCREVIDQSADQLERRLEYRTLDAQHRFRTVKISDACKKCATAEADSITDRREHEIIGPLNGEIVGTAVSKRVQYVIYEKNGAVFRLRADHEITRAIDVILSTLGPVELISARTAS